MIELGQAHVGGRPFSGALATMEAAWVQYKLKPLGFWPQGMLQKHYMHRIAREDESLGHLLRPCQEANRVSGPRINLTWRWIKQHSEACPKAMA